MTEKERTHNQQRGGKSEARLADLKPSLLLKEATITCDAFLIKANQNVSACFLLVFH